MIDGFLIKGILHIVKSNWFHTCCCTLQNYILKNAFLLPSIWGEIIIVVIIILVVSKLNKDPLYRECYRPLFNSNVESPAKIPSRRLNSVIPDLINSDQTRFILDISTSINIYRLFTILNSHILPLPLDYIGIGYSQSL